jgi:hypothetical protein
MQQKNLFHRLSALFVFIASLFVYYNTLSVVVVFWDVGEFIAASVLLQVPHPPGAPLFLLVGRIAAMIPSFTDIAARLHFMSAFASACTVTFLYLIVVRLIVIFRGSPTTTIDKLAVYGSSIIGALSLAFSFTFWFSATEAEVYGVSMVFVVLIIWLAMRWYDNSDKPHNEKYIFLIAYLIGLSVGVHLLALLTIFTILMIIYFKKYEFNRASFIKFSIVSVIIFFGVYSGVVKYIPSMLDGEVGSIKSDLIVYIPGILVLAALYGIYYSTKYKLKMLNIALVSFLLIIIGYSTYTTVMVRANTPNMPMNENDPSNMAKLVSYLGREQYGEAPLFLPRRYSQEPMHTPTWQNYTSDMDFMFRYQINHMYVRYLLWNYIGAEGDWQDAGVSWKLTLGIPFLIGLLGLYHHIKKDWKMGISFLALFLVMGVILALYQNQQDPQPRERDYFYVGSFFVFSIWIGMGVIAIIDFFKKYAKSSQMYTIGTGGILAVFLFAIPGNMLKVNWYQIDRSGNYVAWDYSYNILQTCAKDAILFTNGDNDTFPLWYLQDVEGVRRDIRIVNLSLVNTPWYIKQLKNNEPHGAMKVPIAIPDDQIDGMQPMRWEPRQMSIPVPPEAYKEFGVTDTVRTNKGKIDFTMPNTITFGDVKAIKVQDIIVHNIIMSNDWKRPVYFAVTVSPDSKIGLDSYMWMDGLAWRLKPVPAGQENGLDKEIMEANVMGENIKPAKGPQYGYLYRNLNNSKIYYDENQSRLTINYRSSFVRLALYYNNIEKNPERAKQILARMDHVLPMEVMEFDWRLAADVMSFYSRLGVKDQYEKYSNYLERKCWDLVNANQAEMSSYYNPYRILLEIYDYRQDYTKAIDVLNKVSVYYPNDQGIKSRIADLQSKQKLAGSQKDTTHK